MAHILGEILANIPKEILPTIEKIITLVDPQFQRIVADVLSFVPHEILLAIVKSKPDSEVKIIEFIDNRNGDTKHVRYASWMKRGFIPKRLKGVDWRAIMGAVSDQFDHDICWAVVVCELIRALRLIEKRETDPKLVGLHAVSLVAAGEENGERYVLARSSHGEEFGEKGYLKISLDVMLVYVPTPGEPTDAMAVKYFSEPSPLVRRFSYPRLLTPDEEERRRNLAN